MTTLKRFSLREIPMNYCPNYLATQWNVDRLMFEFVGQHVQGIKVQPIGGQIFTFVNLLVCV